MDLKNTTTTTTTNTTAPLASPGGSGNDHAPPRVRFGMEDEGVERRGDETRPGGGEMREVVGDGGAGHCGRGGKKG